jgi:hypothetical protein
MYASDEHHHRPVDSADDWKRNRVGNNLGVPSMESVRRKFNDILAV